MQAATLMFEEVRRARHWSVLVFFLTTLLVQQAHDYIGVSWHALYIGSFFYFVLTVGVGEYFSRRRARRHKTRMAEFDRQYQETMAKVEDVKRKLKGEI